MNAAERALLAAIRDALDIPQAADEAGRRRFELLQDARVASVLGSIDSVLEGIASPEIVTQTLRDHILRFPVTYRPYEGDAQEHPRAAVSKR